MPQLYTAGLVLIKENKVLLALSKNKNAFYLPGGKINENENENAITALIREIEEELSSVLKADKLQFYKHITAPAFGEEPDVIMEQDCFFYNDALSIMPSAEIERAEWFSKAEYLQQQHIAPGVVKLFDELTADGFITSQS
ncbi:MAG: DNA mismatch repair protein MutT [Chitinophaga sp.]|mgnify:CR=1 FL=1|jgi:8-oxo-dGTP pyrophosphatase MutT (NUDIX family)|nr:DNA mismatch repair protein MutT [Chitinophaga sp.]